LRYLVAAALSLAGLLLSHNISALHFAPLLAAYLIFILLLTTYRATSHRVALSDNSAEATAKNPPARALGLASRSISTLLAPLWRVTLAAFLGLGLAAVYWLPALVERQYVQFEKITQGFFDFRQNFLRLADLVAWPLPLDLAAINPEFPLSLGPAQLVLAAAGITVLMVWSVKILRQSGGESGIVWQFSNPAVAHSAFFAIIFFAFIYLTQASSTRIWEVVPLLELTEFPWRLLGPAIFCASVLAATALLGLNNLFSISSEKIESLLLNGLVLLVIGLNGYYLYPSQFIPWGTPTPADAFAYEVTTGAIGTNSAAEMLPRWVTQLPEADVLWPDYVAGRPPQKLDPTSLPPGATVEPIAHLAESDTLQVDTPQPFVATLFSLYWPGWQVYLDGQRLPVRIATETGLIQATIPAGRHTLTIKLEPTPVRSVGLWLSLLSAAVLAALVLYGVVRKSARGAGPPARPDERGQNASSAGPSRKIRPALRLTWRTFTMTSIVLLATYLLARPLEPWFTVRSEPDRPQPADRKLQVDFADQIRLVGADELPQTIQLAASGETSLNAVLYWRALQDLDTNYAVFLHLDAPNGLTVATVDEANPANIPTASWPPGLYLRNPLQLNLPADLPPIRYNVTTGIYDRSSGERLPIQDGEINSFNLGPVWLTGPQTGSVPPLLASFGPQISLHGADLTDEKLTLLWQTSGPIAQDYRIFVHVLDDMGNLLSQSDGVPYDDLYPLTSWQPPHAVAIGIYDPASGQRLPAVGAGGELLAHDRIVLTVFP
jgi:hypothetical protein